MRKWFGEKDEDEPEEVMLAFQVLCGTKLMKDKMLEADLNLERSRTACQGIGKMPIPDLSSLIRRRRLALFKLLLVVVDFFQSDYAL